MNKARERIIPSDREARESLARHFAKGDTVRASLIRRSRLMDVALLGSEAVLPASDAEQLKERT